MSQAAPPAGLPLPTEGESLYEIIDGRRVELPPMGIESVLVATTLVQLLGPFVRAHRLGRIAVEALFEFDPTLPQRRPDVSFVSYARWPRERAIPGLDNAWAVVPDLAVEVDSPSNIARDVLEKVHEYFAAGVRRVWVVYPSRRQVYDYSSPKTPVVLDAADTLDGGDVFPGLRLPVADLFEDVTGAPA